MVKQDKKMKTQRNLPQNRNFLEFFDDDDIFGTQDNTEVVSQPPPLSTEHQDESENDDFS